MRLATDVKLKGVSSPNVALPAILQQDQSEKKESAEGDFARAASAAQEERKDGEAE